MIYLFFPCLSKHRFLSATKAFRDRGDRLENPDCTKNQKDYRIRYRAPLQNNIDILWYRQMEYKRLMLSQLRQLTVTPDAVSAPCQNCWTMGVLHNLRNNTWQVRYLYLLLSCDTALALSITSCLYLLAQSRSSRIKVSPSSIPNTAIKHKTLLQQITSSTT